MRVCMSYVLDDQHRNTRNWKAETLAQRVEPLEKLSPQSKTTIYTLASHRYTVIITGTMSENGCATMPQREKFTWWDDMDRKPKDTLEHNQKRVH